MSNEFSAFIPSQKPDSRRALLELRRLIQVNQDDIATLSAASGITAVVDDTTPQLGGPLDVNGQEIQGNPIDLHSSGDVVVELGDALGVNKLSVRDSAGVEQAAVDSDGNITTNGTVDGRDVAADGAKLDGIEAGATADQSAADIRALGFFDTSNDGAGSLLDADLLDGNEASAFATAAQGATADSALQNVVEDTTPQLGGPLDVNGQEITGAIDLHSTGDVVAELGDALGVNKLSVRDSAAVEVAAVDSDGNLTLSGTVDGRDVAADGTKLDGIEAGATADQSAAEILAALLTVDGTGSLLDADLLDGNQATAFATSAQGALADSALQAADIGVSVQAFDADLSTIAAANNGAVLAATTASFLVADEAKLDAIEAGADVTDAANVETAIEAITLTSVTGATGDEVLIVDSTDGGLKAVLWENLPGAGGGMSNLIDDTTPQLGGSLDVNGFEITGAIDLHSTGDITMELGDAAGVNKITIKDSAAVEIASMDSDGQLALTAGSATAPAIGFITGSDYNLGIYRVGNNNLGITCNGTLRWDVDASRVQATVVYEGPDGSATTPTYSFSSDPDTGLYYFGVGEMSWASGGAEKLRFTATDLRGAGGSGSALLTSAAGSVTDPCFSFVADTDTGLYRIGSDDFAAGAGNSECMSWTSGSSVWVTSGLTTTTGNNTIRYNGTTYELLLFTSLLEHKKDILGIADLQDAVGERSLIYDLRPVLFHEKDQIKMVPDPDWEHPLDEAGFPIPDVVAPKVPVAINSTRGEYIAGFIAEEVHEVAPELTGHDENGELSTFSIETLIPHLVAEVQRLGNMVEEFRENADPTYQRPRARSAQSSAQERALFNQSAAKWAAKENKRGR